MESHNALNLLIQMALEEDIGAGDLTAKSVLPSTMAIASIVAKEDCVVSGVELIGKILSLGNSKAQILDLVPDGTFLTRGMVLGRIQGNAREILTLERTILNFLQRLCGIATNARQMKKLLQCESVKLLDTRKTTPGFRMLEKKAVKDGGLWNHRSRLDEAVLLKENHLRAAGSISKAIENLKNENCLRDPWEIEVTCWDEIEEALNLGAKLLLLDNFSASELKSVVEKIRTRWKNIYLEASGGINQSNLSAYSATGVDAISLGALTHSVKSADLSLLFDFR